MNKNWKREYFSIPNLMGYLRIVLVPVYLWVYLTAQNSRDYYLAAGIMLVSFLTDLLDGQVARRFNMITEFGKVLDPVADKLTQGSIAISFLFRYPDSWPMVLILVGKEAFMFVAGLCTLRMGKTIGGARWYGKVCTAVLDAVLLAILLAPELTSGWIGILNAVAIAAMVLSLAGYLNLYVRLWTGKMDG